MRTNKSLLILMVFLVSLGGTVAMQGNHQFDGQTTEQITEQEKEDLLFHWEEERMARDLYRQFYEAWGDEVFSRVAQSEQRHMEALGGLIRQYELQAPTRGAPGSYEDAALNKLYETLLARGLESREEAFQVAIEIENKDREDLNDTIKQTEHAEIKTVYGNLLDGSKRHLRAFGNGGGYASWNDSQERGHHQSQNQQFDSTRGGSWNSGMPCHHGGFHDEASTAKKEDTSSLRASSPAHGHASSWMGFMRGFFWN